MTFDERDTEQRVTETRATERLYPAPLAGIEPLEGHVMDPDGEESTVEEAELKARSDEQAVAGSMELTMSEALLDGQEGLGLLREVRDANGEITEIPGSWRPGVGVIGALEDWQTGRASSFEGSLHKADGTVEHVRSDVTVTSVGEYRTDDGERLQLVNFEAAVPGMLDHAASDDGAISSG